MTCKVHKCVNCGKEYNANPPYNPPNNNINNISSNTKLLEDKRVVKREKKLYQLPEYLLNIPLEDVPYLVKDTSCSPLQLKHKGEELYNWLHYKNKVTKYSDFKRFLRNVIIKNYPSLSEVFGATKNAKDYRGF